MSQNSQIDEAVAQVLAEPRPLPLTEDERAVLALCQQLQDAAQGKAQLVYALESQPANEQRAALFGRIARRLGLPAGALGTTHRLSDDGAAVVPREGG